MTIAYTKKYKINMNENNVQEIDDIDFSPDSMKAASISKDRLVICPLFENERFRYRGEARCIQAQAGVHGHCIKGN